VFHGWRPFLSERLDQQLQQRQARETGICPVREELYAQCFDELIRQVTINCAERGQGLTSNARHVM
jgi:dynein light intermediate chain